MQLIPAIDIMDGKCVRLMQGKFTEATHYDDDPVAVAARFAKLNVQCLHVVDLDGARTGSSANRRVAGEIVLQTAQRIQVGGGIRSAEDIDTWLQAGAQRVVIGSIAIEEPERVIRWMRRFGSERIVPGLDVRIDDRQQPLLTSRGWTRRVKTPLWDLLDRFVDVDCLDVLCTDVGRDGALSGPSVGLYQEIVERYPTVRLQASGGIRNVADLYRLREIGCVAAISGRALLDGRINSDEVAAFRQGE